MANVALNTDPEAPLDLGTSLTAVADGTAAADYHYDDTGSLASDIQAMCNKTDGTFTLDTAGNLNSLIADVQQDGQTEVYVGIYGW
jgi:hypothetical protein